ncbi:hypothetical protein SAMN05216188_111113 [Lentzea xinjiangensis]|uniref:Uncharacterized protein n=1 Tax=Lentzea xinjiangensis TaxID=402600 RepID=A0A1H9P1M1_9PSEU|nr:hypothetical protein SAMN05216188_111113 [Lentzea xinjiangensis]
MTNATTCDVARQRITALALSGPHRPEPSGG